jgi:transketolase
MNPKIQFTSLKPRKMNFGPRRGVYFNIADVLKDTKFKLEQSQRHTLEGIDLAYRTLCAMLYNFVPTSGHPGGSISSGRIVEGLIYSNMDYNFSNPDAIDADMLVYAAGHKAMGLYAMWALRNELIRIGKQELLPEETKQLRLEDLLGFRRNPTNDTPLFKEYRSKTLDGHPTPAIPCVRIATGASGVGVPAALGLALAVLDCYDVDAPKVHILEGEGGMTPGRVHESLAAAASARLFNAVLHVDWNQASIDSNHVCREGKEPGDYTQWDPVELCYCHDWNVIFVPNGKDFEQVLAAQQLALTIDTGQPTAIVYRTVKGWKYGIEGRTSHGAGHKFCSEGYYQACEDFENHFGVSVPRFSGEANPGTIEKIFFETLVTVRRALENKKEFALFAANQIVEAQQRLKARSRQMRQDAPKLTKLYEPHNAMDAESTPAELQLKPGDSVTLRAVLGSVLNVLNKKTEGAVIGAAADLLSSTSVINLNKGFDQGYFNAVSNPKSRLIAVGGICEDAMGAFMAGLSSFGQHIGVTSSYGAFIGALEHVAARLHGIGQQARESVSGEPYKTWIMINAHAGVKTGEDGPTHADPQVLQLLQENFPKGVLITLTPWDPQEIWPLMIAGLKARPAILCPFVTRPPDKVIDRAEYGLPPASEAEKGIYAMRLADRTGKQQSGTLVLQGNGVATIFVQEVLPKLDEKGLNLNVFYISSAELFGRLPFEQQEAIFPEVLTYESMGITDFTLPTMYRWVRSNEGIRRTLHSFRGHHYLGSGQAHKVLQEAGIHAEGQLQAILDYARSMEKRPGNGNGSVRPRTYPFQRHVLETHEKVWLTCFACGAKVDPLEYFGDEPLPNDEYCLECEHRDVDICPYCQAYWLMANPSIKFYCHKCTV